MNKKGMLTVLGFPILAAILFFSVSNGWGWVCENCPPQPGRMTGGGSIFTGESDFFVPAGTRITHGFELHCDASELPNNLEVNIHQANGSGATFHLDKLATASCWNDTSFSPNPPSAPFDSGFWSGTGTYNGVSGYCASWAFTDEGEPGSNDRIVFMHIWQTTTVCGAATGTTDILTIVDPGHRLTFGNHQAHTDN